MQGSPQPCPPPVSRPHLGRDYSLNNHGAALRWPGYQAGAGPGLGTSEHICLVGPACRLTCTITVSVSMHACPRKCSSVPGGPAHLQAPPRCTQAALGVVGTAVYTGWQSAGPRSCGWAARNLCEAVRLGARRRARRLPLRASSEGRAVRLQWLGCRELGPASLRPPAENGQAVSGGTGSPAPALPLHPSLAEDDAVAEDGDTVTDGRQGGLGEPLGQARG